MDNRELADRIAHDLFAIKTYQGAPKVTRLVLMSGATVDAETNLGGLCEGALADRIEESLNRMLIPQKWRTPRSP